MKRKFCRAVGIILYDIMKEKCGERHRLALTEEPMQSGSVRSTGRTGDEVGDQE